MVEEAGLAGQPEGQPAGPGIGRPGQQGVEDRVGREREPVVQDQDRLTCGAGECPGHRGGRRAAAPPGAKVPGVVHRGGGVARRQRQQLDLGHDASRRVVRIGHGSRRPR